MFYGTVKWFCPEQGFGIIMSDQNNKSVFVHFSNIVSAGLLSLAEGQKVIYDIACDSRNSSKVQAVNVSMA